MVCHAAERASPRRACAIPLRSHSLWFCVPQFPMVCPFLAFSSFRESSLRPHPAACDELIAGGGVISLSNSACMFSPFLPPSFSIKQILSYCFYMNHLDISIETEHSKFPVSFCQILFPALRLPSMSPENVPLPCGRKSRPYHTTKCIYVLPVPNCLS